MNIHDPGTSRYLIRFATPSDHEAIQRFNERLAAGGAAYRMPLDERLDGEGIRPRHIFCSGNKCL